MDERVAGCGVRLLALDRLQHAGAGDLPRLTEVVTLLAQRSQQPDDRDRGVQTDGVADPRVLGGVRRQDQRDPSLRRGDVPQSGVVDRDLGDPPAALGIGDVVRQSVAVGLLEGERHRDDPAVELRHRHLGGHVERRHALVRVGPGRPTPGQAQSLQDRDVEGSQCPDVPGLVVTAGAGGGRLGPTGGEHGGDQGVQGAQVLQQIGRSVAQRSGEDRLADTAGGIDGVGQSLHVRGVAGGLLGPVEEDPHPRAGAGRRRGRSRQHAPVRLLDRRLEADPGQQHGVGQEGVQLGEVLGSPLGQVDVRVRGHPHRYRRQLHQRGVGCLLTSEHHHRLAGRPEPLEPAAQVLRRSEQPDHDEVGVGQGRPQIGVAGLAGVRPQVVRAAGTGREEVGVGGREQGYPGHRRSLGQPRTPTDRPTRASRVGRGDATVRLDARGPPAGRARRSRPHGWSPERPR